MMALALLACAALAAPSGTPVLVADAGDLPAVLRLRQPALLRPASGAAGAALKQRWTWKHIAEALSAKSLGGPLTVQRDRDSGLFPFVSGGALTGLLPSDSPFGRSRRATLSIDGAELPALLRGQAAAPEGSGQEQQQEQTGWRYYFSGKIMEVSAGKPVAHLTQPLGYELLEDQTLVQPLARAAAALRRERETARETVTVPTRPTSSAAELQGNLWLSSGNASTPLHYDTSANVFVQLRGRKRFYILPPEVATILPMEPAHSPGHRQLAIQTPAPGRVRFSIDFLLNFD